MASAVPSTTAQEEIKKLEENYAVVLKNAKEAEQRESVLASENTALKEKISHVWQTAIQPTANWRQLR